MEAPGPPAPSDGGSPSSIILPTAQVHAPAASDALSSTGLAGWLRSEGRASRSVVGGCPGAVARDTTRRSRAVEGAPRGVQHNSEKGEPAGVGVSGGSKRGSGAPKCTSYAPQVDTVGWGVSSNDRPVEVAYFEWDQPRRVEGTVVRRRGPGSPLWPVVGEVGGRHAPQVDRAKGGGAGGQENAQYRRVFFSLSA